MRLKLQMKTNPLYALGGGKTVEYYLWHPARTYNALTIPILFVDVLCYLKRLRTLGGQRP